MRVLTELQDEGIAVPDEASVTGFDDLIWASVVTPSLTTIRMDMARIAEVAVTALVRAIDGEDPANRPAAGRRGRGYFQSGDGARHSSLLCRQ